MIRSCVLALLLSLLAACAGLAPQLPAPTADLPAAWQAPMPGEANLAHEGRLASLTDWWRQHDDSLLLELIESAQALNASIATARARLAQVNAERVAAGAALLPAIDGVVSAQRRSAFPPLPGGNIYQGAAQASWEVDLFGVNRLAKDAAQLRLTGAEASWHAARVSVAAEVAGQYYQLRACRQQWRIAEADAKSRDETARLTGLAADAGFQSPANAALARASAAEGHARLLQQRALCELDVKALVMLSGMPETALRARLGNDASPLKIPAALDVPALPAATLAQRPDVFAAARQVAATAHEVGSVNAQRYPRLTLAGNIGLARFEAGNQAINLTSWSIGPLQLSVPVFDAGRRRANLDAARARYDEAASAYREVVRRAVREVVNLDSIAARSDDAQIAIDGFMTSFDAAQLRYKKGFGSLIELEEARRSKLGAETALVSLQRERIAAWIALYRAAGGGWQSPASSDKTLSESKP